MTSLVGGTHERKARWSGVNGKRLRSGCGGAMMSLVAGVHVGKVRQSGSKKMVQGIHGNVRGTLSGFANHTFVDQARGNCSSRNKGRLLHHQTRRNALSLCRGTCTCRLSTVHPCCRPHPAAGRAHRTLARATAPLWPWQAAPPAVRTLGGIAVPLLQCILAGLGGTLHCGQSCSGPSLGAHNAMYLYHTPFG
jgi:hypothetical protein